MKSKELELTLKRAELQNESLYNSFFSANPAVILFIDPETGDIKDANSAACHYYGWPHSLLCTMNIAQVNVQTQQEILAEIQKAKAEKRNCFFLKHRLSDGEIRDVEVLSNPIQINNSTFLHLCVHDITDRRIAEEKLSRSEEIYQKLIETINNVAYEITDKGIIKHVSPSIVRVLGYAPEEVIGKNIVSFIYEEDKVMIIKNLSSLCKEGSSCFECRYIDKNGDVKWIQSSTVTIVEQGIFVGKIGTLTDITELKLAEEALLQKEAITRKMVADIGDVLVIFNQKGTISYLSQNIEKWFGWNPGKSIGSSFGEHIYPDDLELVRNFIENLSKVSDNSGKIEFRYQCKNGRYRWIEFMAVNKLYDADIHGFIGHYHDITERIQAENQFKLLSKIIEKSPVSVMITDKQGNIEYTNPKFTDLTGYTLDEIEGKTPRFLQSGEHSKDFYKNLWETILSGNDWHGEFRNRKKNGELFWESSVISSVHDKQGNIVFFFQ
jgi:PAS domain S-box-containing protein